jgi:hypothetical protein
MKKYIKAAIAPYVTLKDWIEENTGVIRDDMYLVIRCIDTDDERSYWVPFEGTLRQLRSGRGDSNYFLPDGPLISTVDYIRILQQYAIEEVSEQYNHLIVYVYFNGE